MILLHVGNLDITISVLLLLSLSGHHLGELSLVGSLLLGDLGLSLLLLLGVVSALDEVTDGSKLLVSGNVKSLLGILTSAVEPVLDLLHLLSEVLLLIVRSELGVLVLELASHLVDVLLKSVLSVLSVSNELVLHDHRVLELNLLLQLLLSKTKTLVGDGQILLLDPLLNSLGGDLTALLSGSALNGLLNLNLLGDVSVLDGEETGRILSELELADSSVRALHARDGPLSDELVGSLGKSVGVGVSSGNVKGSVSVEGDDLGVGVVATNGEDLELGHVLAVNGVPGVGNGVEVVVLELEVSNSHGRGVHGADEGGTSGGGLLGVGSVRKGLVKDLGKNGLDGGDSGRTANDLNVVKVSGGNTGSLESLLDGDVGSLQQRGSSLLELLSGHAGRDIDVVHDRLNVEGCGRVGGENLLESLGLGQNSGSSLGVSGNVDLVLGLEDLGKVLGDESVKVSATKVLVKGGSEDLALALLEGNHGDSVGGVSDVDKADDLGLILGELGVLEDTPSDSGGGDVVGDSDAVEASNGGGVLDGKSLLLVVPHGDSNADIGNLGLGLGGGSELDLVEEHGGELGGSELLLLALVGNLGTGLAVDGDKLGGNVLLLGEELGVVAGSANDSLQRSNGVLQVGHLVRLGSLTKVSVLEGETDLGRCASVGHLVGEDIEVSSLGGANVGVVVTKIQSNGSRHVVINVYVCRLELCACHGVGRENFYISLRASLTRIDFRKVESKLDGDRGAVAPEYLVHT